VPRQVARGVWRVAEPGHVNSWLVEGSERAALVDSGLGLFSIREVCERLTDKPVEVVNTHSHFDHIGGDHEFEQVAIHEAGVAQLARETDPAMLTEYLLSIQGMHEGSVELAEMDRGQFAFLVTPDELVRSLPEDFDGEWRIGPVEATRALHDGDRFDLGDRSLRVIRTQGHSPDGICLLLEDAGVLFTGDTVTSGVIWAHQVESDLPAFVGSTALLAGLEGEVSLVCMGHHLRSEAEPAFLAEVAEAFAGIASGALHGRPAEDEFGDPALLVEHGRVMVYLPDPARPRSGLFDEWE